VADHDTGINLVILDRDGVINEDSDAYVKSVEEWKPIAGSIEAIAALRESGYEVAVATNQSGIARGYYSIEVLDAMHEKLRGLLLKMGSEVGPIAYCPHGPDDDCNCRKPKPGLLRQISEHYQFDLSGAYMVGDSLRDLQAGAAAGCQCVLVKTGKGEQTWKKIVAGESGDWPDLLIFDSLSEFAKSLVRGSEH